MGVTKFKISPFTFWLRTQRSYLKLKWRCLKAKYKLSKPKSGSFKVYDNYQQALSKANLGRLSQQEISEITQYQVDRVGQDFKLRTESHLIQADTLKQPSKVYQHAAKLCQQVLDDKSIQIKSMANVGARVDIVNSYLAQNYSNCQFYSVDFQPDLDKHNSLLPQSRNWQFLSGYALDLIDEGKLKADLFLFSSTVILFRHQELIQYLTALKNSGCKALVFNDAWWYPNSPERLSTDKGYIAGPHCTYHYNLPKIVEKFGYHAQVSQFVDCENMSLYQLIAYQN